MKDFKFSIFFEKIEIIENGCWVWKGCINHHGYGSTRVPTFSTTQAHRIIYEYYHGDLDPTLTIDHLCRNRRCVNPEHLEQVTMKDNQTRGLVNQYKFATHCIKGHLFSKENTIFTKKQRVCKICHRISDSKYRKKQSRKPLTMERIF